MIIKSPLASPELLQLFPPRTREELERQIGQRFMNMMEFRNHAAGITDHRSISLATAAFNEAEMDRLLDKYPDWTPRANDPK